MAKAAGKAILALVLPNDIPTLVPDAYEGKSVPVTVAGELGDLTMIDMRYGKPAEKPPTTEEELEELYKEQLESLASQILNIKCRNTFWDVCNSWTLDFHSQYEEPGTKHARMNLKRVFTEKELAVPMTGDIYIPHIDVTLRINNTYVTGNMVRVVADIQGPEKDWGVMTLSLYVTADGKHMHGIYQCSKFNHDPSVPWDLVLLGWCEARLITDGKSAPPLQMDRQPNLKKVIDKATGRTVLATEVGASAPPSNNLPKEGQALPAQPSKPPLPAEPAQTEALTEQGNQKSDEKKASIASLAISSTRIADDSMESPAQQSQPNLPDASTGAAGEDEEQSDNAKNASIANFAASSTKIDNQIPDSSVPSSKRSLVEGPASLIAGKAQSRESVKASKISLTGLESKGSDTAAHGSKQSLEKGTSAMVRSLAASLRSLKAAEEASPSEEGQESEDKKHASITNAAAENEDKSSQSINLQELSSNRRSVDGMQVSKPTVATPEERPAPLSGKAQSKESVKTSKISLTGRESKRSDKSAHGSEQSLEKGSSAVVKSLAASLRSLKAAIHGDTTASSHKLASEPALSAAKIEDNAVSDSDASTKNQDVAPVAPVPTNPEAASAEAVRPEPVRADEPAVADKPMVTKTQTIEAPPTTPATPGNNRIHPQPTPLQSPPPSRAAKFICGCIPSN
jgi:hypothetical protein